MPADETPADVTAIRREIERILNKEGDDGRVVGNSQYGVYAFYDYDGEPIYVGQTSERLRTRIGRHLTNQRTDAVAMNVLDPFEVLEIEMWPLHNLEGSRASDAGVASLLNAAEWTVYKKVLGASKFGAVLNEKEIAQTEEIDLPPSVRGRIVPDDIYELRKHPDVRIARRANTIAALSRVISERRVSKGLRRTLITQAKRLEDLSTRRLEEIGGEVPVEQPGEETGEQDAVEAEPET
jgi:hypothetical protein